MAVVPPAVLPSDVPMPMFDVLVALLAMLTAALVVVAKFNELVATGFKLMFPVVTVLSVMSPVVELAVTPVLPSKLIAFDVEVNDDAPEKDALKLAPVIDSAPAPDARSAPCAPDKRTDPATELTYALPVVASPPSASRLAAPLCEATITLLEYARKLLAEPIAPSDNVPPVFELVPENSV